MRKKNIFDSILSFVFSHFNKIFGAFVIFLILYVAGMSIYIILDGNVSVGVAGVVETRCIDGYSFLVGQAGRVQQVLNENGGGIACQ